MPDLPDTPFLGTAAGDLGLTRAMLRRLERDGVVRRVLRNVYVRADVEDTPRLRACAARLVVPDHVVVADHSAAWLWDVDTYSPAEHQTPMTLEVVSVDGHEPTDRDGVLGGRRDLLPSEICEVDGIDGLRVTTPVRTACDLACLRGRMAALAVLDAFMRQHGVTTADYEAMLPRFHRRRGVKQLRELVGYASPRPESMSESWTAMAIIDAGLPQPEYQVWVNVPGYGPVRLDLAYKWWKIAVEYDGEEHHTSPEDRERDVRRRAALRQDGWIVIVVRRTDLSGLALDTWLAELKAAVADRCPEPRRRYSRGEWWGPARRH